VICGVNVGAENQFLSRKETAMNSDNEIQSDVIEELQVDPSIDHTQIGVAVKNGIVSLTGFVPNYSQKWETEKAAKRVYGVKGIADDLYVHPPTSLERTDAEIAQAALNAMNWHTAIPDDKISVTADHGFLTLEGAVDWQYQKDAAESVVRHLNGVKGVLNSITLTPLIKPADVQSKIQSAFERHADLEARRIGVEATGGKVVLSGNVRSWNERDEAQRAAWNVPGVKEIENHLVVTP
jgi:osmotically-inducible protein OsmY